MLLFHSATKQLHEAERADLLERAETLEGRIREMEVDSRRQVAEAKTVAEQRYFPLASHSLTDSLSAVVVHTLPYHRRAIIVMGPGHATLYDARLNAMAA